jgi:hypothetical protein
VVKIMTDGRTRDVHGTSSASPSAAAAPLTKSHPPVGRKDVGLGGVEGTVLCALFQMQSFSLERPVPFQELPGETWSIQAAQVVIGYL